MIGFGVGLGRVLGFFVGVLGGVEGSAFKVKTFVGHFLPVRKSCMAPDLVPTTTYWSNWPMFTG